MVKYFNVNAVHSVFPEPADVSWFFIGEPVFNFGGFFVDGSEPTIYRLPSIIFLVKYRQESHSIDLEASLRGGRVVWCRIVASRVTKWSC